MTIFKRSFGSLKSGRLSAIVLVLFCIILILSPFYPVYFDDVFYIFWGSRAGYDGWKIITPFPQCTRSFGINIPIMLLPGRWLAWKIHDLADNFFAMRAISDFIMLSWLTYTSCFLKLCVLPGQRFFAIMAGLIAIACLGTLPFSMLMNRPETAMLFAATFFASLPFIIEKYPSPSWLITFAASILFLVVASWLLSSHAKSMFYIPLVLLSALYVCKWNKPLGALLTGVTLFMCYEAFQDYWRFRISCPESPTTSWAGAAINPSLFADNKLKFWNDFGSNILSTGRYFINILFLGPAEYWQPRGRLGSLEDTSNILAAMAALYFIPLFRTKIIPYFYDDAPVKLPRWQFILLLAMPCALLASTIIVVSKDSSLYGSDTHLGWLAWVLYGLLVIIFTGLANFCIVAIIFYTGVETVKGIYFLIYDKSAHSDQGRAILLVPMCLMGAFLAQCGIQYDKVFYNATLIWMTYVLCGITIIACLLKRAYWKDNAQRLKNRYMGLCIASVLSQAVLLLIFIPAVMYDMSNTTPNGIIYEGGERLWALYSPLHYDEIRGRILADAKMCHIPTDQTAEHILVDNMTYLTMRKTYEPFKFVRFEGNNSIHQLFAFLKRQQSSGIIMDCAIFDDKVRPLAKESGGFCCMSKEQINDFK